MEQKQKNSGSKFYIWTLIVAVLVCILVFALVLGTMMSKDDKKPKVTETPPVETLSIDDVLANDEKTVKAMGVYTPSTKNDVLKIFVIDKNLNLELKITPKTEIKDQYGKNIVLGELKEGTILDIGYIPATKEVLLIQKDANMFEKDRINGLSVSERIVIGNEVFEYDQNTIVKYSGEMYSIQDITEEDYVNIIGVNGKIYYIDVLSGHGELEIIGDSKISNPVVEIDTKKIIKPESSQIITLAEGPHKIAVLGDNIQDYNDTIFIEKGNMQTLDLRTMQRKSGYLTVTANVTDYVLLINDEVKDYNIPVSLDYGLYKIVATKQGYEDYNVDIEIRSERQSLRIEMVQIPVVVPTPVVTPTENVKMSKLKIDTNPQGADIYIDNAYIGLSPISQSIEVGSHTVIAKKDGYMDLTLPVEVVESQHSYLIELKEKNVNSTNP